MDPLQMILPKGIVFNIDRVYKEVANYAVVPPEKIYEYWHVYTTTFGKLKDPTANRLENFWWHVMGSDRRSLSGPTLARLFEQISNGPTFVPLRGPPNRYEGPSFANIPRDVAAAMQLHNMATGQPPCADERVKRTEPPKAIPSSSSKPAPSHTILKKPRGPSSSGPRPTARFVSPQGSDAEEDRRESEASSSTTSAAGTTSAQLKSTGSSGSKEKHKKASSAGPRKKPTGFVASSASKRRPGMPRRQSSQSSATGSEVGSREERSTLISKYQPSKRSVSPIAERPSKVPTTKSNNDAKLSSARAAEKRPAVTAALSVESGGSQSSATPQEQSMTVQPTTSEIQQPKSGSKGKSREFANRSRGSSEQHVRSEIEAPSTAHPHSDNGTVRAGPREMKLGRRVPSQGLLSTSTATTSNIAAQGTIIEFDDNAPARAVASAMQEDIPESGLRRSGSAATLTPTPPSNTPSVPLGRSKSQLTLLLERQGEKKSRR